MDPPLINARPAEVEDRAVPGHWEGDLVLGLDSSAIGTLVERTTRFTMLLHLPRMDGHGGPTVKNGAALAGHGAQAVRDAIATAITTLPEQLRRALTWDQGTEMAQHTKLRIDTGLEIFFCDPRSPWHRGTNEKTKLAAAVLPRGHRPEQARRGRPRRGRSGPERQATKDTRLPVTSRGPGRAPTLAANSRCCDDSYEPGQFRSHAYVRALRDAQLSGPMGRVGTCADNPAMEPFFSLLQKNVLNRQRWQTREQLRLAIVVWIEKTHHHRRRQDSLGRLTPEFETLTQTAHAA